MGITRYYVGQYGSPDFDFDDKRYVQLGVWLTMEIGAKFGAALDALDSVYEVLEGSGDPGDWAGESMEATFTPAELILVGWDGTVARYPIAEVKDELERYWRFLLIRPPNPETTRHLRPDLPEPHAYLLQWERIWSKRHPYRGRIDGIPAHGPS